MLFIRTSDWPVEIWRMLTTAIWDEVWADARGPVVARREWPKECVHKGPPVETLDVAGCQSVIVEILAAKHASGNAWNEEEKCYGTNLKAFTKAFGVNLTTHHNRAKKACAPKPKPAAKKKATPKKKKPSGPVKASRVKRKAPAKKAVAK